MVVFPFEEPCVQCMLSAAVLTVSTSWNGPYRPCVALDPKEHLLKNSSIPRHQKKFKTNERRSPLAKDVLELFPAAPLDPVFRRSGIVENCRVGWTGHSKFCTDERMLLIAVG